MSSASRNQEPKNESSISSALYIYEAEDRSVTATPDSSPMGHSLFIYRAFRNILSRCITEDIQYVMIKLTKSHRSGGEDIINFMFWDIINSTMADFLEEVADLFGFENLNNHRVSTVTSEGEIRIENQEDFYCALLLYLKEWCYDSALERPMNIEVVGIPPFPIV